MEIQSTLSLRETLKIISRTYGESIERFLFKPTGQIKDDLLISINGEMVRDKRDIQLKNRDKLTILPVLAGG